MEKKSFTAEDLIKDGEFQIVFSGSGGFENTLKWVKEFNYPYGTHNSSLSFTTSDDKIVICANILKHTWPTNIGEGNIGKGYDTYREVCCDPVYDFLKEQVESSIDELHKFKNTDIKTLEACLENPLTNRLNFNVVCGKEEIWFYTKENMFKNNFLERIYLNATELTGGDIENSYFGHSIPGNGPIPEGGVQLRDLNPKLADSYRFMFKCCEHTKGKEIYKTSLLGLLNQINSVCENFETLDKYIPSINSF